MVDPVMDFGKHCGRRVSEVPTSYLRWVIREATEISPWLRRCIQDEVARRDGGRHDTPQPPPRQSGAMVNIGEVVRQWWREMALRYHPDRGGSTEVMQALNNAHQRLRELAGIK
jgi:hypothetical protein